MQNISRDHVENNKKKYLTRAGIWSKVYMAVNIWN
jgi:hypothetical protein